MNRGKCRLAGLRDCHAERTAVTNDQKLFQIPGSLSLG